MEETGNVRVPFLLSALIVLLIIGGWISSGIQVDLLTVALLALIIPLFLLSENRLPGAIIWILSIILGIMSPQIISSSPFFTGMNKIGVITLAIYFTYAILCIVWVLIKEQGEKAKGKKKD